MVILMMTIRRSSRMLPNVSSEGRSHSYAVSFFSGIRGFVLSVSSGTEFYFDDVYQFLPIAEVLD